MVDIRQGEVIKVKKREVEYPTQDSKVVKHLFTNGLPNMVVTTSTCKYPNLIPLSIAC
jgi:hypothetical protein